MARHDGRQELLATLLSIENQLQHDTASNHMTIGNLRTTEAKKDNNQ